MYDYLGVSVVQVPVAFSGHMYCFVYVNPGTMCGIYMQRMGLELLG